jgi:AAA15 family ATPase/GTPase
VVKLHIEDFGPFEKVDLELRPLTIFIGKNSTGKSMLLYLLWALSSASLEFYKGLENEHIVKIAERVIKRVESGETPREDFEALVRAVYENMLAKAINKALENRFKAAFGGKLKELVRIRKERAVIEIRNTCGKIKLSIAEKVNVEEIDLCLEDLLKKTKIIVKKTGSLNVSYEDIIERSYRITSISDILEVIESLFRYHLSDEFDEYLLANMAAMLPDSRAGVARTVMKFPHILPDNISLGEFIERMEALEADKEYIDLYYSLAELKGEPELKKIEFEIVPYESVKPLLNELGILSLEVVPVGKEALGKRELYDIYVRMWSGKIVPLALAPSGIREMVTGILALTMIVGIREYFHPYARPMFLLNIFIEEPEAHLHPKAQKMLARIIARAVNTKSKRVIITTHSDYLLSALNNHILLSRLPPERLRGLGYSEKEAIPSEYVAAYLTRIDGDKAVVERLEISEDGIPEDEFAKVSEELLGERSRIYSEIYGE